MTRKCEVEEHSGKTYSIYERRFIHFCLTRGIPPEFVAKAIDRPVRGVINCFYRLCHNASDYDDKKEYNIDPKHYSEKTHQTINSWGEEYIYHQLNTVKRKSNIKKLARELGVPVKLVSKTAEIVKNKVYNKKSPKLI